MTTLYIWVLLISGWVLLIADVESDALTCFVGAFILMAIEEKSK